MKNNNYITIAGWMVNELHLTGNELLLYALIYGFSQDGESEYYGSQSYMAESLGITRECVLRVVKKLEDKGLVEKIPSNSLFQGKMKYKAIYSCDETSQLNVTNNHTSCDEKSHNNIDNNIDNIKEDKDKSLSKKEEIDSFVDKIYKMYPTKCPKRNASLGKCKKDKERIKKLLKQYSQEDIEKVVVNEIGTKLGKAYMQNFATFLNNFPDPSCIECSTENIAPAEVKLKDGARNTKGEVWSEQLQKWLK